MIRGLPIDTVLAAVEAARQGLVLAKTEADAATRRAYIDEAKADILVAIRAIRGEFAAHFIAKFW